MDGEEGRGRREAAKLMGRKMEEKLNNTNMIKVYKLHQY